MLTAMISMLISAPAVPVKTVDDMINLGYKSQVVSKPIGDRMEIFGRALLGTPYVGWTLEKSETEEFCVVTVKGLDCVTFAEVALNLARLPWKLRRMMTEEDLERAVTQTRYRSGVVNGYLSRLHYTSDWIRDGVKKGTVTDLTSSLPGSKPFVKKINFMSSNFHVYRQLKANPGLLDTLLKQEADLTKFPKWYLPKDKIAAAEPLLQTGDIIAITDTRAGMDCAHVGMIIVERGVRHFVHASSTQKKVVFDVSISEYLAGNKKHSGIMVARPTGK